MSYKMTKEHRDKISKSNMGHIVTNETREKLSKIHTGKSYHDKSGFVVGHKHWDNDKSRATQFKKGHKQSTNRTAPSGANHYNWKGGITSENEKIRKSKKYINWRKNILIRDNFTCQICGVRGGRLSVDHIKPFSLFPELRFEDSNARVLCWSCHTKTETFAGRMRNYV